MTGDSYKGDRKPTSRFLSGQTNSNLSDQASQRERHWTEQSGPPIAFRVSDFAFHGRYAPVVAKPSTIEDMALLYAWRQERSIPYLKNSGIKEQRFDTTPSGELPK
jgi:hypothetical protein